MIDEITLTLTTADELPVEVGALAARLLAWLAHGDLPPGAPRADVTPAPPRR